MSPRTLELRGDQRVEVNEISSEFVLRCHYFPFFRMPLPLSARLNSLATFCGMPTRLANLGLCAAAAIVRACLADLLGIGISYGPKSLHRQEAWQARRLSLADLSSFTELISAATSGRSDTPRWPSASTSETASGMARCTSCA